MNVLERIYFGWCNIFHKSIRYLKFLIDDIYWVLPLVIALALLIILLRNLISDKMRRRRYLINKNRIRWAKKITEKMSKYSFLKILIDKIALKICVFNDRSFETNREYSSITLILVIVFIAVNVGWLLPTVNILWYQALFFLIFIIIFLSLVFYIVNTIIRFNFTKQLPRTFKLLNSRFGRKGDILEAINISLEDLDKAIARELTRILDVLVKNDDDIINQEFEMIDKIYENEYFTILLNLIKHAYYKPGNKALQKIFSNTTSNILFELQVQKKLSMANIWYILMAFLIPYGITKVEAFNIQTLGPQSMEFYNDPLGIAIKIAVYISMFIYILCLLLLKRTA
ncbi:MAG: hypothetical protein FH761_12870 [Firmicutes bacterium]|nr:hypothetical protein [Bacillota bacterium]